MSFRQSLHSLGWKLRKLAPDSLRRTKRLARVAFAPIAPSPALAEALFANCRVCASRQILVSQLPKQGRIAEIGVARGRFSQHILSVCEPRELHLVDLDFAQTDPGVMSDPRVTLHRDFSHVALAAFADESFDWIYIDADHSYEGCARDAAAAASKVTPGGHLVFNDFAHVDTKLGVYGVHRAVTEFARDQGWPFTHWAYHPHGLYDVALQKPA